MAPKKGGFRNATGVDPAIGLHALLRRVDRAREEGLDAMALMIVRQVVILLSTPGRGRIYVRRGGARKFSRFGASGLRNRRTGRFAAVATAQGVHRASAAGDPPAVDTNMLRGSITYERIPRTLGWSPRSLTGSSGTARRVGTNVAYAPDLEFGTLGTGGFIAPRPFLRPAVAQVSDEMTHVLIGRLRAAGRTGLR